MILQILRFLWFSLRFITGRVLLFTLRWRPIHSADIALFRQHSRIILAFHYTSITELLLFILYLWTYPVISNGGFRLFTRRQIKSWWLFFLPLITPLTLSTQSAHNKLIIVILIKKGSVGIDQDSLELLRERQYYPLDFRLDFKRCQLISGRPSIGSFNWTVTLWLIFLGLIWIYDYLDCMCYMLIVSFALLLARPPQSSQQSLLG